MLDLRRRPGHALNRGHDFRDRRLAARADIVDGTRRTALDHRGDHRRKVLDINIVAEHGAVTHDRQRLTVQNMTQEDRDDALALVRVLPSTVGVRDAQRRRIQIVLTREETHVVLDGELADAVGRYRKRTVVLAVAFLVLVAVDRCRRSMRS